MFRYAFPSGKTFLCIYSVYIVSVSFVRITCKQPLGDLTAQVHLKDGAWGHGGGWGGVGGCTGRREGGTEADSSTYIPLQ